MNKLERRKIARTARNNANRRARFIESYIKARHADVYEEVDKTYKDIEKNNKGKKDLRKTTEFLLLTTKYKSLRQYYDRPNRTATKQYTDNMVLTIPLMDSSTRQEPPRPLLIPDVAETTDPTSPPQPLLVPDVAETTGPAPSIPFPPIPDVAETTDLTSSVPLPPIPDAMFQQLLSEIRNDPELDLIFNDMALGEDDITDLSGVNFDLELQTPLEAELSNIH